MNQRAFRAKGLLPPALSIIAMVLASLKAAPLLPAVVPTHFDLHGDPNGWSSKTFVLFFMPVLTAAVIAFIQLLMLASPEPFAMPNSRRSLAQILWGVSLLLLGIHCGLVFAPLGWVSFQKAFSLGMALFLIVVGNVLGKTERNFVVGIRLPWTLESDANWVATHRFAARAMVVAGLILGGSTFLQPSMAATLILLFTPLLASVLYSYRHDRRED